MSTIFDFDETRVTVNRRKDVVSPYRQSQDQAAIEAKLDGLNLHSMGLEELRLFLALLDNRVTQILDANHNVTPEEATSTLNALTQAQVRTRLSGKSIHDMNLTDLQLMVWLIDQVAGAPELNAAHTMP